MYNLGNVAIGDKVRVVAIKGDTAHKQRMVDMGLTKGTTVFLRKLAPFGDPIEVNLRGYELCLRKSDASMIEVEKI